MAGRGTDLGLPHRWRARLQCACTVHLHPAPREVAAKGEFFKKAKMKTLMHIQNKHLSKCHEAYELLRKLVRYYNGVEGDFETTTRVQVAKNPEMDFQARGTGAASHQGVNCVRRTESI